MRDDVSAYNYERELAPKDLTKTLMIDYPIGTTIELQLVRIWISKGSCIKSSALFNCEWI